MYEVYKNSEQIFEIHTVWKPDFFLQTSDL